MASLLPPLLTGLTFGAALTLSPLSSPSLISHPTPATLQLYGTTLTVSTVLVYLSNKFYVSLARRSPTSYGWFNAYDGNLVGGLLQGVGMVLSGADPGTGIVQVVTGRRGAGWWVVGGVLGGVAEGYWRGWRGKVSRGLEKVKVGEIVVVGSLFGLVRFLGIREDGAVLSSEAAKSVTDPVMGGCLIGVAQAVSILIMKRTMGISSAYSDLGAQLTSLVRGKGAGSTGFGNVIFAVGVALGAMLVGSQVDVTIDDSMVLQAPVALAGGFLTIFGARMAGGCTCGHAVSGMSTFSASSLVTVLGIVGGGSVVRLLNRI